MVAAGVIIFLIGCFLGIFWRRDLGLGLAIIGAVLAAVGYFRA